MLYVSILNKTFESENLRLIVIQVSTGRGDNFVIFDVYGLFTRAHGCFFMIKLPFILHLRSARTSDFIRWVVRDLSKDGWR